MRRMRSEYLDPDRADHSVAADILVREQPEEEEDDEEDNGKEDDDENEEDDEGYSE